MTWHDWYPEGSTVFIGHDSYTAKHNEHDLGLDLYKDGERVMTIAPEFVPKIVDGIRYSTEERK
ncbi:hypothetical protein [Shinella sp.]|uniref:hypothetical protein n=1 Tax=Shinella sp. TaxID=1870904 RepID=UPI002586EEB3|nr:hypothetical protein [Shinella sp.]MCW5706743.1 hypothetical protein [Shinella sp.]